MNGTVDPSAGEGFPFRFACRRSGNCCARPGGMVRVGVDDIERIAEHLGMSRAGCVARYVAATGDRLAEGLGGRCVFLDEADRGTGRAAGCRIYPVRPERCRTWPFWPELAAPGPELREAMRFCPGILPEPAGSESGSGEPGSSGSA